MFTLTRMTRNFITLICAMSIFVYACGAETLASYSGQYTADLEQKQMLLESIKEDAYQTENQMKENIEKRAVIEDQRMSSLRVDKIGLAKLIPAADKINLAFINMSGTLSPQGGEGRFSQDKEESRN